MLNPLQLSHGFSAVDTGVVARIICQHVLSIVRLRWTENIEDRSSGEGLSSPFWYDRGQI